MSGLPKLLIIYAVAIPLAILLGFLISAPGMGTIVIIGLLAFLFSIPVLLKHHHFLLILMWNSAFNAFFLPGQPHLWLLMAVLSFGIAWLNNVMGQKNFIKVPEITRPLIFFATVVVFTAGARGGFGVTVFGSAMVGGRGYFYMMGAIIGYFALTAGRIPSQKANRSAGWFFISGTTFAASNLVFLLGPAFYILYLLVPPEYAISQALEESGNTDIARIAGLPPACMAIVCFFLVRYGLKGILDWRNPWRLAAFATTVGLAGFGGFRGIYLEIAFLCFIQFFVEGLHRTVYLPVAVGLSAIALAGIFMFASRLPLVFQRAVSFLPVNIDSSIRADAEGSVDWRLNMWRVLEPEIPKYLLIGKGYQVAPEDIYLADTATQMGLTDSYEVSRVAGDYHSGPFSLIISFGIFGVIAFLWLGYAGTKALYNNFRYGSPSLHRANVFLMAFFVAHLIFFIFLFGDIRADLSIFTGTLGLSVSLNGGVAKKLTRRGAPAAAQMVPQAA